jgi:ribose transport system permease protein
MTTAAEPALDRARSFRLSREDKPILIAAAFVLVILAAGTAYTLATQGTATLLQPQYLLQQLQVGAFLGIVAAGMMVVILLGHIDLSVPWTLTAAAMMATAVGEGWAIPVGIGIGLSIGLVNGLGVAYLRVPSMIFTLGVNAVMRGLMVAHTGGFAPQTAATDAMQYLAVGRVAGIPVALLVWLLVSAVVVVILRRTAFGRSIYAIGNRERAAYLSGINTNGVILGAFMLSGMAAGLAGVLLAGYSNKAYQGMGDAYLLPAIAAVVIGGTNILGGQGRYLGTFIGVILIVLLNSVLSIMQMPEAGRQIIYGLVIIAMLLVYGRGSRVVA